MKKIFLIFLIGCLCASIVACAAIPTASGLKLLQKPSSTTPDDAASPDTASDPAAPDSAQPTPGQPAAPDTIAFVGSDEAMFEPSMRTASESGFGVQYLRGAAGLAEVPNLVGIVTATSILAPKILEEEVPVLWITNEADERAICYTPADATFTQELVDAALSYPPHEAPVRLLAAFTDANSELAQAYDASRRAGKIFPVDTWSQIAPLPTAVPSADAEDASAGETPEESTAPAGTLSAWLGTVLEENPPGRLDGILAETSEFAMQIYEVMKQAGRTDFEIFSAQGNSDVANAHTSEPQIMAVFPGFSQKAVQQATEDLIAHLQNGTALQSKQVPVELVGIPAETPAENHSTDARFTATPTPTETPEPSAAPDATATPSADASADPTVAPDPTVSATPSLDPAASAAPTGETA